LAPYDRFVAFLRASTLKETEAVFEPLKMFVFFVINVFVVQGRLVNVTLVQTPNNKITICH
jgi:hypothetical protein